MRPRRSLSRGDPGDAGEVDSCGLVLSSVAFLTPRLSAVLTFSCEYARWPDSADVAVDTASELTVPARLRGGGCSDCDAIDPMSELILPGTM